MQPHEIRALARTAALEQARRLIVEFPDILAELNRMQAAPRPVRDVGSPDAVTSRAVAQAIVDRDLADFVATPGRRMTAAGRQAIVDAQRRRWAKHHKKNGGAK